MIPEPLLFPFIGITISKSNYTKVKELLPPPSYIDTLQSRTSQTLTFIYVIDGYITSHNQYRWISNIKLGLQKFLFVSFKFEEEFRISDTTEITNNIYTIDELSKAFKATLITYPKIMYPETKQELYKRLCWYGIRLIHQKVFTKEAMTSAALLMNKKLDDKYQNTELHKKVLGSYMWLDENIDSFKVRLDEIQLKEAHSKGARIKNRNQAQKTKDRIEALLKNGDFRKPNGKINISLLAKAMGMNRKTVAKYMI